MVETIVLTKQKIKALTNRGHMPWGTIEALGLTDYSKGWMRRLVGRRVSRTVYEAAKAATTKTRPHPRKSKPTAPAFRRHKTDKRFLHMAQYLARNERLKDLGFSSYEAYLNSDLWQNIRARVLDRAHHLCEICGCPADVVHHSTYRMNVLTGKSLDGLKALCHGCHQAAEFDGDRKVGLDEAEDRIDALIAMHRPAWKG